MSKFAKGQLKTGAGTTVVKSKQAIAIALAEKKKKGRPYNPVLDDPTDAPDPLKGLKSAK